MNPQTTRYSPLMVAMHWFMVLLLVAVYALIELRGIYPKGSDPRELMKALHFMLGMSVLVLVVVRLALRLSSPVPPIEPAPRPWELWLARLMHLALYGFLILMPLLGWLMLSASGKSVPFFGLEIPPLIGESKAWAGQYHDWHEQLGKLGYALIGFHALAGLFHHTVKRDNTLKRMWFAAKG